MYGLLCFGCGCLWLLLSVMAGRCVVIVGVVTLGMAMDIGCVHIKCVFA